MNPTISNWSLQTIAIIFLIMQVGCTNSPNSRSENERWVDLATLVDGVLEVNVSFPKPIGSDWPTNTVFAKSKANNITGIFSLGYDPGHGRMDGAMWVYMHMAILRIEKESGDDEPLTFDDVIQTVYISNIDKRGTYQLAGVEFIGDHEWYKVNYNGGFTSEGVSYYRLISGKYSLLVSLEMFGEGSDNTKLYKKRLADLHKAMASVKITVADFANQNEE